MTYFLISVYIERFNCIRITIHFTDDYFMNSMLSSRANSYNSTNSYNKPELDVGYNNNLVCSDSNTKFTSIRTNQEDNSLRYQNVNGDTRMESKHDSINASLNVGLNNNLYYEETIYQKNTQALKSASIRESESFCIDESVDKQIPLLSPNDSILIFDYSYAYMIRSRYFDSLIYSGFTEIILNIKNITKSNIDVIMCKECLNILCYGLNYCILGLNNENFLDFIWFFHDLSCYSESDALDIFYKNLLPFLFSYIEDKSSPNVFNMKDSDFLKYRNIFLPFLTASYDTIDIFFNINTKELMFIEKKGIRKFNLFGLDITEEIVIRTTPKALFLMQNHQINYKQFFLEKIIGSFRIIGMRISGDDIYYSEYKDSEISCSSLKNNSEICNMQTSFCLIFTIIAHKTNEIKLIEFERILLSETDISTLKNIKNLETLILVKCNSEKFADFLRNTVQIFGNLRNLQVIGYTLDNGFFKLIHTTNIEILDLSCSRYGGSTTTLTIGKMRTLEEFRINYSNLNSIILESIIECNSLKVLRMRKISFSKSEGFKNFDNWRKSYRILDISGGIFTDYLLKFFLTNIYCEILILENFCSLCDLIKILDQKSLHLSTKNLNLSKNLISYKVFKVLDKFENLEYLNISNLNKDSLEFYCLDLLIPPSSFDINPNIILDKDNCKTVPELSPNYMQEKYQSIFDYKTGFLECLCATGLSTFLKGINISGNEIDSANILRLEWFLNLDYLIVSFNDRIFSDFLKEYGALKCSKLKTLVLVSTNINNDIYYFVMTLPLLRNFELRECKSIDEILTSNLTLYPMFLETIFVINTEVSSHYRIILNEFSKRGISVIFY
ncbi:hypothetical protein CWI38_0373p0030 [Hamiltosporidium tvaerminnensis]|uniref:Uncharacterized protein n=1 Tax=Hamiltosporidium tvaerminnensis TaxID=1176355 RepID=A0A4Q9LXV0_9MICR|nr:hypothetical protein CWI38_0373p0030 [Hamiltosporidium tvaerminnensis]